MTKPHSTPVKQLFNPSNYLHERLVSDFKVEQRANHQKSYTYKTSD